MSEHLTEKEIEYRYAGFWMRFWAYLLDLIVVASINAIIVSTLVSVLPLREVKIWIFPIEVILITIITFLYFVLLTKFFRQTIGKRVFGLKVISKNEQTEPLTWGAVIFREVIGRYVLEAFFFTYSLYLIIAFQSKKQGLHDLFADTYVIHE